MTRHVERQMVEDEYTKARRLSVLKRRERQGRRATYKEAEAEVHVPMGCAHAAELLQQTGVGHSEGTKASRHASLMNLRSCEYAVTSTGASTTSEAHGPRTLPSRTAKAPL